MEFSGIQNVFQNNALYVYLLAPENEERISDLFETLEEPIKCQKHLKEAEFICLNRECQEFCFICSICLMATHKIHAQNVFLIEQITKFIHDNKGKLTEIRNKMSSIAKEIISKAREKQIKILQEWFDTMKQKLILYYDKEAKNHDLNFKYTGEDIKTSHKIVKSNLSTIFSFVNFDKNTFPKDIQTIQNIKDKLEKKYQNIEKGIKHYIDRFQSIEKLFEDDSSKNILNNDENFSKQNDNLNQIQKENANQIKNDSNMEILVNKIKKLETNRHIKFAIRLPQLPIVNHEELSWPINEKRINKITFRIKKNGVKLLGFTQPKILAFDSPTQTAILKIMIKSKSDSNFIEKIEKKVHAENIIQEFGEKESNEEIIEQFEYELHESNNKESNRIYLPNSTILKLNTIYSIILTAKEGYGCKSKYGLRIDDKYCLDEIFEFKPEENYKFQPTFNHDLMYTDNKQGLFPSFMYTLGI